MRARGLGVDYRVAEAEGDLQRKLPLTDFSFIYAAGVKSCLATLYVVGALLGEGKKGFRGETERSRWAVRRTIAVSIFSPFPAGEFLLFSLDILVSRRVEKAYGRCSL